jgi:hypothetical protein
LRPRQRLLYGLVQFYYPSVGSAVLLGTIATAVYLLLGVTAIRVNSLQWLALWSASMVNWMVLWLWLRRFNLAIHERHEVGVAGMLLALFAGPVYFMAGVTALLRRPLTYAVTAKGNLKSPDSIRTFRLHLAWAAIATVLLIVSFRLHHSYTVLRVWGAPAVITGLGPLMILTATKVGLRGPAVVGPRSAPVPYDKAGALHNLHSPQQATQAFPVHQARFPGVARLAQRAAVQEAGRQLIARGARHEAIAVRPGQRTAMLPPRNTSAGERSAYPGRTFEHPAYRPSVRRVPAQQVQSRDAW